MNWVEIVMLLGALGWGGIKATSWAVRRAGERRAGSLCTCGCGRQVGKLTGCYVQGQWWRLECWKKFNE